MRYAIALGSNRPHPRHGPPARVIAAAIAALDLPLISRSRTVHSRPVGPSSRTYANAATVIETAMAPLELLDHLKALETAFGRRPGGQRWGPRVLDCDIILWTGGIWASPGLGIPHAQFRERRFVLAPLCDVAADWRDPMTGLTVRQLKARLDRARPLA